ncbi:TetR/AcrR family transcriptional regulator, partial [Streptomyces sp. SID7982]|nr:TetR/AcrR family transcriptional regulator [Streptomyces sp. SID7982]
MASVRADGRVERGNQTRQLVLGRAVQIASVEGLEGLSLGRLAT